MIIKITPTWPRVSLPRFHQTAFHDCFSFPFFTGLFFSEYELMKLQIVQLVLFFSQHNYIYKYIYIYIYIYIGINAWGY